MATIQRIDLIATDPAIRGGQPCIAGTSLRVTDLVIAHLFHERTPGQLASDYGVTLAQAHAALAFYYDHKPELDDAIRQHVAKARAYREQHVGSGTPSLLS